MKRKVLNWQNDGRPASIFCLIIGTAFLIKAISLFSREMVGVGINLRHLQPTVITPYVLLIFASAFYISAIFMFRNRFKVEERDNPVKPKSRRARRKLKK